MYRKLYSEWVRNQCKWSKIFRNFRNFRKSGKMFRDFRKFRKASEISEISIEKVGLPVHYQQSLAQFAATGGATGPRATCVAGSPSTLPFSHLAPRCHQVTRDATGFQLEIPIFARTRLSPLTLAVAHARLRERASGL